MSLNQLQQSVQQDLVLSAENNVKRIKTNINLIYRIIKRTIDILGSIVGIIMLVPITIFVVVLRIINKENNGPIFYSHTRLGKNGEHFKLYKFRTMMVGADEALKKYLEENEEARIEFEKNQKLENDPRIDKTGNFLRKTSLDEFPQFINVLMNQMSIVGPRPIVDREIPLFGEYMDTVHSVKPGLTGYWAANGRSDTTYEDRVKMEAYYARNCSLWLDIKIILKTVIQVIKKEGAK